MNRVLMCVPTCGRPEMVKEVLEFELPYYEQYPMDLCFYDSSVDDKTFQVINEISSKTKLRLIYRRQPSELCLDYKLVEILKEVENLSYDYFWLINDSVSILQDAMDIVFCLMEEEYDLIRLPLSGDGCIEDFVCEDANEWFQNCSQGMAHMASTVMRTTLLKKADHDWDDLKRRYIGGNELGEGHGFFFMVAFFLEQILKLEKFKGIFIGNRVKWRRDSPLKKEKSYWNDYVFAAWAKSYVDTIMELPEAYTNKREVIKQSDNITPGRFSKSMLVRYRIKGLYSFSVFFKYRKYLPLVSTATLLEQMLIVCVPTFFLECFYRKNNIEEGLWEERLEKIILNHRDANFIIYGAGLYGERVVRKLILDGYQDRLIGIAVTNKAQSIASIKNIKVYEIGELLAFRKDAVIIIATLPAAANSIRKVLKQYNFKRYYPLLGF